MPAQLTYPGVYIEELPSGVHTITGVATSIAAFVGWAPMGPTGQATLVESWSDFQTQFGGLSQSNGSPNFLGYSVNQFFINGGQQAYIVRLVADGKDGTIPSGVASVSLTDSSNNTFLTLQAASPGNWATNYGITVKPRTGDPTHFSLSVIYAPAGASPQVVESYQNLSLSPSDPLYVVTVINADSNFVAFAAGYSPPSALLPASIPTSAFMLAGTNPIYLQDLNSPSNNYLQVQAVAPNTWPSNLGVAVNAPANTTAGYINLQVTYNPGSGAIGGVTLPAVLESYVNLSLNPNDPSFVAAVLNRSSNFLTVPSTYVAPPSGTALALPAKSVNLSNTASVVISDTSGTPVPVLTVQASSTSDWPSYFGVLTQADGTGFDLEVVYFPSTGAVGSVALPVVLEVFKGLTVAAPSLTGSQFITLPKGYAAPTLTTALNLKATYPAVPTLLVPNLDGSVLTPNTAAFENKLVDTAGGGKAGVYLLSQVNIFNLLCVPGESAALASSAAILSTLQAFCALERAFLIVDSDFTDTHDNLQKNGPSASIVGTNAANSALYFPWIQAPDPLVGNRLAYFPPCGFVAGNYAATDASRGVWKAPAGIAASLDGASGLQFNLTDLQNGDLNVLGINCLRQFRTNGNVVWGARTLQGSDDAGSQWKYVPIRRLALFLESSLYDGTQWVVFEPNDTPLWGQIRLNVGVFMQGLFLQGAFQGTTPQQAYFVKCDSENNPQSSIDMGVVNILVGFAPLYPAEFVVIQIQQIAGQLQS